MSDNEQELLKLETEIYHSDGGIYFAECDTASTRDEIARRLENDFLNKNIKVIKINVGMPSVAPTRDAMVRRLEDISMDKEVGIAELDVPANDLTYAVTRYHGDDAAFFVYLPSEKSELEDLARMLNYARELFAEVKQPIIIWGDKVSLGIIARYAPDFWAWGARVSEFRSVSDSRGYGGEVEAVDAIWREKISDEEIQSYERALVEFQERGDEREAAKVLGQLGTLHHRRGKWDLAIEYYEKDMVIYEALGDRHGLAQTYGNLGNVYADKGEWDRAIEYYEKVMEIFESLGDRHGLGATYNNLGLVYKDKGEWDLAIEYYEKSTKIKEALGDRHGLAQTYNNLGLVYKDKGKWDLAIEYYEKSTKIKEALGDRHGLAQTYNNLGLVYKDKGKWDLAIEYYEKSTKIKEALGDQHGLAQTYGNLGLVYADKGEWGHAIEYYEKDMEISEDIEDRHGLAQTYNNLGNVYAMKCEWDLAIEYYEKSMKIKEALGDRHGLASTYSNLGSMYYRTGERDRTIEYYEKSMKIYEALGDRHGLASTYGNLGLVYIRKGEWDLAIEYYEKDVQISEALGDRHGLAQTYNNLGNVYAMKCEWDLAIEYYEKSMKIKEALGDRHGLASTYSNLGSMYYRTGERDRTIEYYEKSMKIYEALGDVHGAGITLANIGKLYLNLSDPVEAKRNLEDAIEKIHPDARPEYPNALNWLAVSLRMIAEQKKREAKLASSDVEREKLVTAAAKLYREAAEMYEKTYGLPLARMPRSLLMDAHLSRALSYSVQNITEYDAGKAISLLDRAIAEMEAALEFADGADVIRLEGAIASHKAKMCVREIDLHRDDAETRDELLYMAVAYLREASGSFESLGETGACSSKTCDGCKHLYTALGLIRDGYRNKSNQKIIEAVSEIRSAEECYQSISNELGTGVVDQVNEILRRVTDNLKNLEEFDPGGAVDAANDVFDALDEIAGVGLRNMIRILVFDEAGNVTERKAPKAGQIAMDGGINISIDNTRGDVDVRQTGHTYETGKEPPPEKQKSISRWDFILGAISGLSVDAIAIILMHYYFEESVKSHPILLVTLFVVTIFITIFIRHKLSKSKT